MEHDWYILDGHTPVRATMWEWVEFHRDGRKSIVAKSGEDGWLVSTVFLCSDHRFGRSGPPILFETMIFATALPELDQDQERYTSWDDALAGHAAMVERCRAAMREVADAARTE